MPAVAEKTRQKPATGDYCTLEEMLTFPSEWHFEVVNGRLREMPMPTGRLHGKRTALLSLYLMQHVVEHNLGECVAAETGFLLSRNPDTVKAPDFGFVAASRLPATEEEGPFPVVPDLVVETRSPRDYNPGARAKIQEWLGAGVRMALDLDPARQTLTVYRPNQDPVTLGADDTFDGADVLPGLMLPLSRVFA